MVAPRSPAPLGLADTSEYHRLHICPFSARFCVFSQPLPVSGPPIVRPPSSVRQKATNLPASANQCLLLFSFPSVPYAGLHPPQNCAAGGTWLGCGWGGRRRQRPPAVVVSPPSRRQASPAGGQVHAYARRSISVLIRAVPAVVLSPSSLRQASLVHRTSACLLQPDDRFPS